MVGGIAAVQAPSGAPALPGAAEFLIRNVHLLSMDPAMGGDIHVRAGAIVAVGADPSAPGAQIIDARNTTARAHRDALAHVRRCRPATSRARPSRPGIPLESRLGR